MNHLVGDVLVVAIDTVTCGVNDALVFLGRGELVVLVGLNYDDSSFVTVSVVRVKDPGEVLTKIVVYLETFFSPLSEFGDCPPRDGGQFNAR